MLPENLQNKRIGIIGFGVNNRSLTHWLLKHGAHEVIIYDENPHARNHGTTLQVEWVLGKEAFKEISADIIFRTPGIPLDRPEIVAAKEKGIQISSQTQLFLELCLATTIGVTGTKGKGTVSTLISRVLEGDRKVYLAGNIGKDPFEFLDDLTSNDIVILELSSFQLEDMSISPYIAVVLGVTSDHLDYHHTNEAYRQAKTNIVNFQKPNDLSILNLDSESSLAFAEVAGGEIYYYSAKKSVDAGVYVANGEFNFRRLDEVPEVIAQSSDLKLPGAHNIENAAAAILVGKLMKVPNAKIKKVLQDFRGLPHRLEKVVEHHGIAWYNDSLSTNPAAAMAAIDAFLEPKILIAGGSSKGVDYLDLGHKIAHSNIKELIVMGVTGPQIAQAAEAHDFDGSKITMVNNLTEAVNHAKIIAEAGDVVILSPASASFDQFASYAQRGDMFKELVKQLTV